MCENIDLNTISFKDLLEELGIPDSVIEEIIDTGNEALNDDN